jgi:hypothetical protein
MIERVNIHQKLDTQKTLGLLLSTILSSFPFPLFQYLEQDMEYK